MSVPVTLKVKSPSGVLPFDWTVSMAVNPAAVPLVGVRVAVTPAGSPDRDRLRVGRLMVVEPGVRSMVTV